MCDNCSTLMLKVFNLFQNSLLQNDIFNCLVNKLDQEIDEVECELFYNNKLKKCRLNINLHSNEKVLPKMEDEQCIKCPMKFKSKFLLKKHIHITHKNTNNAIICDKCGKIFTKNSSLAAHLRCHEPKQCPYCLKTLKSLSHYRTHLKNHTTLLKSKRHSKFYDCVHCDYHSVNKCTLEAHINKIHLGIRPFTCDRCQKGFYKKDNLVQHLATHNEIKDKTCYICGNTFGIEKTLQEHLKLHSGQKPFKCDICNIGFITSGRRHEHMKRKHREKKETCVICGKKFSLKKDLNTHLKKVHCAETENVILKLDKDNKPGFEVVKVINYKK